MTGEVLSQAEIDALLENIQAEPPAQEDLSSPEKVALAHIGLSAMERAAAALSNLMDAPVKVELPEVSRRSGEKLKEGIPVPSLMVMVNFAGGLKGTAYYFLEESRAAAMAEMLLGEDGETAEKGLTGNKLEALREAWNQMTGSAVSALAGLLGREVVPVMLRVSVVGPSGEEVALPAEGGVALTYPFQAGGVSTHLIQVISEDMAGALLDSAKPRPSMKREGQSAVPPEEGKRSLLATPPFPKLETGGQRQEHRNIDLILDVYLELTVELGRTRMQIRDILELGPGSVVELNKLAGEAVDILVNGKPVARGEVVVIDENFGVRISEILSQAERVNKLGQG